MKTIRNNKSNVSLGNLRAQGTIQVYWDGNPEELGTSDITSIELTPDLRFKFSGYGITDRHTIEEARNITAHFGLNLDITEKVPSQEPEVRNISNDNSEISFAERGQYIHVLNQRVADRWNWREARWTGRLWISHDLRVAFSWGHYTEPLKLEQIEEICRNLGLEFKLDDPAERLQQLRINGELQVNALKVLAIAGIGPEARSYERTDEGLVFYGNGQVRWNNAPWSLREARAEAQYLIESARQWIHNNLRTFKRHVKLNDYQAVQLWLTARGDKVTIRRVKVGETVDVRESSGQLFGSGGGWGKWLEHGEFTRVVKDHEGSSNFMHQTTYTITFDRGPAVIFTASGDGINGGRIFWRELIVAE